MKDNWMLRLADDRQVSITQYALLEVIVEEIRVHVTAYVLASTETFELLLSKNWMTRVHAVEDHGKGTLTIQGKMGLKTTIRGAMTESPVAELIADDEEEEDDTASDNDDDLAEDELARLTKELNELQYCAENGQHHQATAQRRDDYFLSLRSYAYHFKEHRRLPCLPPAPAAIPIGLSYRYYPRKDCFVTSMREVKSTDLIEHCINLEPYARPVYAKQMRYTRKENEYSSQVFPQMEEAGIIM
ncbi:MAG: hypothetical protein M1826_003995 [Phylliscum demangeonii]|nr:MAG: hypothetical protein M1826_003995 [Phylliscum demangeonii]